MAVSLRLKDELVAEIDRIAMANGQTRSSWIATTLARAVVALANDDLPNASLQSRGHPDDLIRVTIRLHRSEIEAIEKVGAPLRLSRNEWIKRTIRWQLWDKAAVLRLAPVTTTELGKTRKLVTNMSANINHAVHALNAANMPGSTRHRADRRIIHRGVRRLEGQAVRGTALVFVFGRRGGWLLDVEP